MTVTCKTKIPIGSDMIPLIKLVWIKKEFHRDITIGYHHENKLLLLFSKCYI